MKAPILGVLGRTAKVRNAAESGHKKARAFQFGLLEIVLSEEASSQISNSRAAAMSSQCADQSRASN